MVEKRILRFHLTPKHFDFQMAQQQASEAREFRNAVNSVLRSGYFAHYSGREHGEEIFYIPDSLGIDVRKNIGFSYNRVWQEYAKSLASKRRGALGAKALQQVVRQLSQSWSSYWALQKSWKNNSIKHKPSIPGYSKNYSQVTFNKQMISSLAKRHGWVVPSGWSYGFKIPGHINNEAIESARLLPTLSSKRFVLEVVYKASDTTRTSDAAKTPGLVAAIDPGLINLTTMVFSDFREAKFVRGNRVLSTNANFNRKFEHLRSELDKERYRLDEKLNKNNTGEKIYVGRIDSTRENELREKRKRILDHDLHAVSNAVVAELSWAGVETLIIGWSRNFKSSFNMGRKNNRRWAEVPLRRLLDDIEWKAKNIGIVVVWVEESYTSKASFLDNDPLPTYEKEKHHTFSGKRINRGTYKSAQGQQIHADVNGAYNILRKYDPLFSIERSGRDAVVHSVRELSVTY